MTHEQQPQPRKAETPLDYNSIAKAALDIVAANMNGALGSQIIADVQALTGYEPTAVAAVFMELAEQGIVERSISDPQAGVVLSEQGQIFHQNFDQLMNPNNY